MAVHTISLAEEAQLSKLLLNRVKILLPDPPEAEGPKALSGLDFADGKAAPTTVHPNEKELKVLEYLDDQLTRFDIWSANIGVFLSGRASLDYRVMQYEDVRNMILQLLQTLKRNLDRVSILQSRKSIQDEPMLVSEGDQNALSVSGMILEKFELLLPIVSKLKISIPAPLGGPEDATYIQVLNKISSQAVVYNNAFTTLLSFVELDGEELKVRQWSPNSMFWRRVDVLESVRKTLNKSYSLYIDSAMDINEILDEIKLEVLQEDTTAALFVDNGVDTAVATTLRNREKLYGLVEELQECNKRVRALLENISNTNQNSREESAIDDQLSVSETSSVAEEAILETISETISRLQRLSNRIRQLSLSNRNIKAERFFKDRKNEASAKLVREFREEVLRILKYKYPRAPEEVHERIANSLSRQKGQFLYRQRHQQRLLGEINQPVPSDPNLIHHDPGPDEKVSKSWKAEPATLIIEGSSVPAKPADGHDITMRPIPPKSEMRSQTTATELKPFQLAPSIAESRATSQAGTISPESGSRLQIPKPPTLAPGVNQFECPYCFLVLNKNTATVERRWRRHVMEDLDPYICVFENCANHENTFNTVKDWLGHMEWKHCMRWYCQEGDGQHFDSPELFQEHMCTDHPDIFDPSDISLLTQMAAKPDEEMFPECPLCRNAPMKSDPSGTTSPGVSTLSTTELMLKHIETHLASLALLALPSDPEAKGDEESHSEPRPSMSDDSLPSLDSTERTQNEKTSSELEELDDKIRIAQIDIQSPDKSQWGFLIKRPRHVCNSISDFFLNLHTENLQRSFRYSVLLGEIKYWADFLFCKLCCIFAKDIEDHGESFLLKEVIFNLETGSEPGGKQLCISVGSARFRYDLCCERGSLLDGDNAIIEELTCINFMGHDRLKVILGPLSSSSNSRIINSPNDEARMIEIPTAINLCLGGKAPSISQAQSLKASIKEGKEQAMLIVKLRNEGPNAYQPDLYGKSILIERHFSRSGGSGFKLKNEIGRLISSKRGDIDDVVGYFQLQVDNPMNILAQEAANSFITHSWTSYTNKVPNLRSDTAMELLGNWMKNCHFGHVKCGSHYADTERSWLPTRLIHVGDSQTSPVLLETFGLEAGSSSVYATLNFCWGRSQVTRTTRQNYVERQRGIPLEVLPRTFRDAIYIARKLGIRYLWIDALCILQDDQEDWSREFSQMQKVLGNSALNIAASSGSGPDSGIFVSQADETLYRFPVTCVDPAIRVSHTVSDSSESLVIGGAKLISLEEVSQVDFELNCRKPLALPSYTKPRWSYSQLRWMCYSRSTNEHKEWDGEKWSDWHGPWPFQPLDRNSCISMRRTLRSTGKVLAEEPLSRRAWSFHDCILSPKTIYYSSTGMIWNCQEVSSSDDSRSVQYPLWKQMFGLPSLTDPHDNISRSAMHKAWERVVEYYTSLDLTFERDKLEAISGIASAVASKLSDRYLAGVWESALPGMLLWEIAETTRGTDRQYDYIAPSWSWASAQDRVTFKLGKPDFEGDLSDESLQQVALARVLDVDLTQTTLEFGSVKSGYLELAARYIDEFPLPHPWASELSFDSSGFQESERSKLVFLLLQVESSQPRRPHFSDDEMRPQTTAAPGFHDEDTQKQTHRWNRESTKRSLELGDPTSKEHLDSLVWQCLIVTPDPQDEKSYRRVGVASIPTSHLPQDLPNHKYFRVIFAPSPYSLVGRNKIYISGFESFSMVLRMQALLSPLPVTILNPYREDRGSTWKEDLDYPPYREQVEWELAAMDNADVIVIYFGPRQAPITLMDLGLAQDKKKKVVVACSEAYEKGGHVRFICERYGLKCGETIEDLRDGVIECLGGLGVLEIHFCEERTWRIV